MISMLITYLVISGCKKKMVKRGHLHNYPMYADQDCPSIVTKENYNEEEVRIKAEALKMRPVDYLHQMNKKRWKPIRVPGQVTKIGDHELK